MTRAADGIVVIDKPLGMTSHDVVGRMRRVLGTRKVGHAGTLDPDASGVLVIGFGRATRLLTFLTGDDKDYTAIIRLGISTTTDDAAGEVTHRAEPDAVAAISDGDIVAQAAVLTGTILQRPSAVSAIKVDGVRSYARVRAGEDVVLPAREVMVSQFDIRDIVRNRSQATIDVAAHFTVSSGTYIRALARDLGSALGIGGHLVSLRRTRSGRFAIDTAIALPQPGDDCVVVPLVAALQATLPTVQIDAAAAVDLTHGRFVTLSDDAVVQWSALSDAEKEHSGKGLDSSEPGANSRANGPDVGAVGASAGDGVSAVDVRASDAHKGNGASGLIASDVATSDAAPAGASAGEGVSAVDVSASDARKGNGASELVASDVATCDVTPTGASADEGVDVGVITGTTAVAVARLSHGVLQPKIVFASTAELT